VALERLPLGRRVARPGGLEAGIGQGNRSIRCKNAPGKKQTKQSNRQDGFVHSKKLLSRMAAMALIRFLKVKVQGMRQGSRRETVAPRSEKTD
jgi:hypothetical protein